MRHIYDFKKRTDYGSSPIRRRTKSNFGRKEKILLSIFVLTIGGWIYTFYFSPLFSIKSIQINGLETISQQSIKDLLSAADKNIFRFNVVKAAKIINDAYFLEGLTIHKTYPNALAVTINEKHPALELKMPNYKYLLDNNGLVINAEETSSTERRAANLPLIEDVADHAWLPREQAVDKKEVEAITFFISNLKTEDNIDVLKTIFDKTEPDLLTFDTAEGFQIMVSYKEDIKTQLFKLTAFLKAQGDKQKNLLYVNARFVDRVYYKFSA